jgi:hypothetical protein
VVVLVAATAIASAAQAAKTHPFLGTLDGSETPTGAFEPSPAAAVDPAGYLYVSNFGGAAIDVYNPAHEFVTAIPDPNLPYGPMAVDSEGNVYSVATEPNQLVTLSRPSSYPPTSSTTYSSSVLYEPSSHGENARAVAVDPSNGHAFVLLENSGLLEYESAADGSAEKAVLTTGGGSSWWSVQVYGANHNIYLANSSTGEVAIFNPDATEVLHHFAGVGGNFAHLAVINQIAVDQSNGNVYVGQVSEFPEGERRIEEYEPDGTLVSTIGPTFGPSLSFSTNFLDFGLTVDNSNTSTAGNVYALSGEFESVLYEFGPLTNTFALSVTPAGTGEGEVTSSPAGIDCGATCSAEFAEGTEVTLSATPEAGSEFAGWSGACTGLGSCKVTMSEAKSVTATFDEAIAPSEFALSVSKAGSGSGTVTSSPVGIDCGTKCSAEFEEGEEVSLSATATSGSSFAGFSGACTGTGACKVTITEAKAVTATFNAQSSGGGGGGGTTNPPPPPANCSATAHCRLSTAIAASKAQVKAGKAALQISCPGPGACSGKLTLTAKITSGKGKNKKSKTKTIGSASFSLKGGESTTVQVKLSGPAKSALAKGSLKAKLKGTGIAPGSVKLSNAKGK